jgi:hypothetical protein
MFLGKQEHFNVSSHLFHKDPAPSDTHRHLVFFQFSSAGGEGNLKYPVERCSKLHRIER